MFLEKTKLKDVSSNDAELFRDLRIILIAAQKNYVLDAPLGDRPIAGADVDVMNVLTRHGAYEMFQELKLVFHTHARVEKYKTSDNILPTRWRRIAQPVSMC